MRRDRKLVEEGALDYGTPASRENYVADYEIQASIAISLKRIADALEAQASASPNLQVSSPKTDKGDVA